MTPFSDSNHRIEKNKKRQKASWLFNITTLLALIKSDPKARFSSTIENVFFYSLQKKCKLFVRIMKVNN